MRAQLIDGSIVDLPKDCHCVGLHEGPHWLHMDDLWRKMNREILDMAQAKLGAAKTLMDVSMTEVMLDRFEEEEIPRLRTKRREMERCNIERFLEAL